MCYHSLVPSFLQPNSISSQKVQKKSLAFLIVYQKVQNNSTCPQEHAALVK